MRAFVRCVCLHLNIKEFTTSCTGRIKPSILPSKLRHISDAKAYSHAYKTRRPVRRSGNERLLIELVSYGLAFSSSFRLTFSNRRHILHYGAGAVGLLPPLPPRPRHHRSLPRQRLTPPPRCHRRSPSSSGYPSTIFIPGIQAARFRCARPLAIWLALSPA